MSKTFDIGISTAYGAAVRGGYAGTYEQFCADLARLADVLEEFLGFSVTIQTLAEGQQATASYENGVLSLGIPKGDTGNGIQSISLLSTVGLVKTYRITYTNGSHFDFPVADGKGIQSTVLNSDYTLTITYTDGTTWTSGSIRGQVGATPHLTIGTVKTLPPSQRASATITGTDENPVLNLDIPKGDTGEVSQAEFDALSDDVDDLTRHLSDVDSALEYINPTLTWTDSMYIRLDGSVDTGSGRAISNYVPCMSGDNIKFVAETNHTNIAAVSFWDRNYSFVGSLGNLGENGQEFGGAVPDGACYARLSIVSRASLDQKTSAYLHIERDTNAIYVIDGLNNIAIEKVNLPTGFTWSNPPIAGKLFKTGEKYFTILDVSSKKPSGVRYYVDPVNGNDENSGKLANYPLKNIQTAYSKSDVGEICLYPAYYYLKNRFTSTQKSIAFTTIANTRATFVCGNKMTWTQLEGYTKIWKAALENANTVVSDVVKSDTKYTAVSSMSELENNENTFRLTTYSVFVHSDAMPTEEVMVLQKQLNGTFRFSGGGTVYLENIDFVGGVGGACECRNTDQTGETEVYFYAKNCTFSFGTTTDGYSAGNGLRITGVNETIVQNCIAKHNTDDGLNYHIDYSGQVCNAVEIDCTAHDNGISSGTDNGSTIHDGAKIIRVNTTAYNNNGPNIADVNDGTQSVNYGCKCHDSGTGVDFQVQDGTAEMWLFDCEAYNSQYSVSIGATGQASIMHCKGNRFRDGIQRGMAAIIYTD